MPILTHGEVKAVAKGIVNMMVADVMLEYPSITKAIDKIKPKEWADRLDDFENEVEEILIDRFGVSD